MDEPIDPLPWWKKPIWLGLVGLALMVGGFKLSEFVPLTDAELQLAELRVMAPEELRQKLPASLRPPPYRWQGRALCLAGMALFVSAGVMMYRQPPIRRREQPEGDGEGAAP